MDKRELAGRLDAFDTVLRETGAFDAAEEYKNQPAYAAELSAKLAAARSAVESLVEERDEDSYQSGYDDGRAEVQNEVAPDLNELLRLRQQSLSPEEAAAVNDALITAGFYLDPWTAETGAIHAKLRASLSSKEIK